MRGREVEGVASHHRCPHGSCGLQHPVWCHCAWSMNGSSQGPAYCITDCQILKVQNSKNPEIKLHNWFYHKQKWEGERLKASLVTVIVLAGLAASMWQIWHPKIKLHNGFYHKQKWEGERLKASLVTVVVLLRPPRGLHVASSVLPGVVGSVPQ